MAQDANTVVESSPAAEVEEAAVDLESLSEEQYNSWRLDGKLPEAKPAEPPAVPGPLRARAAPRLHHRAAPDRRPLHE